VWLSGWRLLRAAQTGFEDQVMSVYACVYVCV
jgi:hypothetical protein